MPSLTNGHASGPTTAWNAYNVPTGKHRVVVGGGSWLANNNKLTSSSPFQSLSPARLSKLKKLVTQYWPSEDSTTPLSTSHSRRDSISRIEGPFVPGAATTRFVLLCSLWYATSALSSNTGKVILNQFGYPVTLTIVQFGFVAVYCLILMSPIVRFSKLKTPTRAILRSTLPMGMFQVGGHMASSMAMSRIPVSTVHTIKALSPLFTVAAYALLFGVKYSAKTYLSLLPLTLGVMLACTFDVSASNTIGLLCAFASALVFVSSNIFFKKIMPSPSKSASAPQTAHKLDKINLLFYSSSMAFVLMIPLWLYYDAPRFLSPDQTVSHPAHIATKGHSVAYYFFMNGTVHFAQNIIAFVILSSTSPVTYSIASLIKRVAVICIAIVWFSQSVHPVQGLGICMTFAGLYMYNNAKGDVQKGENKMRRVEAARDLMLPSTKAEEKMMAGTESPILEDPAESIITTAMGIGITSSAYGRPRNASVASQRSPAHQIHAQQQQQPTLPPYSTPPYQHHSHGHHHPSLHIKVTPPSAPTSISIPKNGDLDSYPSPPPSLDDTPPSEAIPLPHVDSMHNIVSARATQAWVSA